MTEEQAGNTLQQAFAAVVEGRAGDALNLVDGIGEAALDEQHQAARAAIRIAALNISGSSDQAQQVVDALCADQDASLWMLSRVGDLLMELQHPELALILFQETARREPEQAGTHYNVGLALRATGDPEAAIAKLRKAVDLDSEFHPAWAELSTTLYSVDELDDAAAAMWTYLELVPDDVNNWVALGVMESQRGRHEQSEQAFERAAAVDPAYPPLWLNRGVSAMNRGDLEGLRACHKRLADIAAESWQEAMLRAMVRTEEDEVWPAWEAMQEAVERVDEEFLPQQQLDHPTRVHVYAAALEFLNDHELTEQFEQMRDRALDGRVFDERVLAAIRQAHGEHADRAQLFAVLIIADASEALKQRFASPDMPAPAGYCRMYSVVAVDEVQARAAVDDFEQMLGESASYSVKHIRSVSEVTDEYIGVESIAGIYFHSHDDISEVLDSFAENLDLE